jgi:DNA-binding GntR family transcriptional regulator
MSGVREGETLATPHLRASDRAYKQLLEMILELRLAPGTVVNEQALAAQLGIGRMPIHEAIARLAADRFVTVLPRRGTVVTTHTLEDVLNMFEAREAIECGVAYIAAQRATAEDITALRSLVDAADQAREGTDHEQYLRDDHEIHAFLVHMINNALLQDAADRLLLHNLRFWRSYFVTRPVQHAAMVSHEELLRALESKNAELAEQAMREHIASSRQLLQSLF